MLRALASPIPRYNRRVATFGDSRTDQATTPGAIGERAEIVGCPTWLRWLTGQRIETSDALNFGVSGDNTFQMLARIADVMACNADTVIFLGATNDFKDTTINIGQTITNLQEIRDRLLASGKTLIVIAELPRGDTTFTVHRLTTNLPKMFRVRQEILSWQGRYPRLYVADAWPYMAVPGSADGDAIVGMLYDGLHLSPTGAYWLAKALQPIIEQLFTPVSILPMSSGDVYDAALNPYGCMNSNPMMSGTAGTLSGGGTGQVADGWTGLNSAGLTVTWSKVTDSAGLVWQQATWSGTPTVVNPVVELRQIITTNAGLGVGMETAAQFQADAGMTGVFGLGASLTVTVDATLGNAQDGDLYRTECPAPAFAFAGISRAPTMTRTGAALTSAIAQYRALLSNGIASSGTFRVRALAARRVVS